MQPADPLFDRRNVIKSLVIAALSMGAAACILFAPYLSLYWRLALVVANIGITIFAANTNLHLSSIAPSSIVRTDNIESVTVERPATPEQPVVSRRVVPTRAPSGRFSPKQPPPPPPRVPQGPPPSRPPDTT